MYMMQEREEIFPVAVSLATIVFTLELPQHRDVTAEKMGKKCRRSCYSSAALRCTTGGSWGAVGQRVFTYTQHRRSSGPVPSNAKVLEMYFVLVVRCSGCLLPHNGCSDHRVQEADLGKKRLDYA